MSSVSVRNQNEWNGMEFNEILTVMTIMPIYILKISIIHLFYYLPLTLPNNSIPHYFLYFLIFIFKPSS
jgi:hypothetical protein